MKSFISWLKSGKSDFLLFIIVLVLLNLVGSRAFFRIDLTASQSYSLSDASIQLVQTLEEPLSVKVFFSNDLPSPYNTVSQYITDLLTEYNGAGNENFSWESFNMSDPENETIAHNYRLNQIQIQEVTDSEIGFKNVWMSLALVYADRIETIDGIGSSDGVEYTLTTTMAKMINATSALAGLEGQVDLKLYLSPELADFNIADFSSIESVVLDAFTAVNRQNMDRISYERIDPSTEDISALVVQYGIQAIEWTEENGDIGMGLIGLVLEYGDSFRIVPLEMVNQIFGGHAIAGLDTLETSLSESLQSLVSKSTDVGYLTGHGERSLTDAQRGAANFAAISSDLYTFKEINLIEGDIPSNITSLIINGPQTTLSDTELYKIDQFVLRGGNLALFLDPFAEIQDEMAAYYGTPPQYAPIDTGLQKLLDKYGVKTSNAYVMDTRSHSENQQGYGTLDFYFIPVVHQEQMAGDHPISANLSYVYFPQTGALDITIPEGDENRRATVLATTTSEAWKESENIMLDPMYLSPPSSDDVQKAENLSVLVEGKFDSAFDSAPAPVQEGDENKLSDSPLSLSTHLNSSVQEGKIFIAGSSAITTGMVIDPQGTQPIALFVRNAIDYLNGSGDLATMRTKGLSLNVLTNVNPATASIAKAFNQYGLPILVAIIGFLVWRMRSLRRRKIYEHYNRS